MIGIYKLENGYFNLALEKVKKYYLDKGEQVEDYIPLKHNEYEKVYASSIFNFTDKQYLTDDMIKGGTGIDIKAKLPDEIEQVKVKMNKGFTMRGCIRNCSFCVVPQKEGKARPVGDIYDLWDGKSKEIMLYDNNILALPEHFKLICSQLRKEKLKVDWNQGLDIRLLNDDLADELRKTRHIEYKFSWDGNEDMTEKLEYIYKQFKRCTIFVIVGFLPYERIMEKLNIIRKIKHNGYLMRHSSVYNNPEYIQLARWVNQHNMFQSYTYEEFCKKDNEMREH